MNAFRLMAAAILMAAVCDCADEPPPSPPMGGTDGVGGFDGTGGSGGSGGIGGIGGTGGTGGTAGTGGTGGTGGVGGATAGACNNPDDIAALTTLPTNPREVSATCALTECQLAFSEGEEEFITCVAADCMQQDVPGLSLECARCYGELEWCSGELCWNLCANFPCGSGCLDCALQCRVELDRCTGRMSTDCDA